MFSFSTIEQYHRQLTNNEATCVGVVQHYLAEISRHAYLNAYVDVYASEALDRAKELDDRRLRGMPLKKLHGVVIAIKDVICYQGHKVSAASKILQGFTSIFTSTALQCLLDEDAIIIGNCNCDEFAMGSSNENSCYGRVLNHADNLRVSGGSSGGSAVAVQADLCMLSLGSDTGGSIRQPADFCGIIGLKPGYGSISRYGLIAYASSFDQIGIFGKNIQDIETVLKILTTPDPHDSTMAITFSSPNNTSINNGKYNFCYFRQAMEHPSLDREIAAADFSLFQKLREAGHTVTEVEFELLDYIVPAYYILTTAEASSNLSRYDGIRYGKVSSDTASNLIDFYISNRTEGFGKEVKRRIMLGTFVLSSGYYDAYFSKAQRVRKMMINQITEIFDQYDAILSPTSPTPAFLAGLASKDPTETYLADIYTVTANLTGIPAISLPLFSHSYSIPFGIQIMTNRQHEVSLLQISEAILKLYKQEIS